MELTIEAKSGNLEGVIQAFAKGADVNARDQLGVTALMWASRNGHLEVVQYLLEHGADIGAKDDRFGLTSLFGASIKGHTGIVKILLDKGANANAREKTGYTVLMRAAAEGYDEIVKLLLDRGGNLNETNKDGCSALVQACVGGHTDIVRVLLERGAEINTRYDEGITALTNASRTGHLEVVKLLLYKGADVNAKTDMGNTALILAAMEGHSEIVRCLLDHGAELEAKNAHGNTALMLASLKGHTDVVELLNSRISREKAEGLTLQDKEPTMATKELSSEVLSIISDSGVKKFFEKITFIPREDFTNFYGYNFAFDLAKIIIEKDRASLLLDERLLLLEKDDQKDAIKDLVFHALTCLISHTFAETAGIKELQLGGAKNWATAEEAVPTTKFKEIAQGIERIGESVEKESRETNIQEIEVQKGGYPGEKQDPFSGGSLGVEKLSEVKRVLEFKAEAKRLSEDAKRRTEEQQRANIQSQRRLSGQCIMCGTSLGFFDKLFKRVKHKKCNSYRD